MSHDPRAIHSYVDLTWPDLDLNLALASYLHGMVGRHPFSSIIAEFALAAVSGLVLAADRAKRVSFDLWPDINPTYDLAKEVLTLHKNPPHWELSIAASRFSIRLFVRKLDRGGGEYASPQPTEVGWKPKLRAPNQMVYNIKFTAPNNRVNFKSLFRLYLVSLFRYARWRCRIWLWSWSVFVLGRLIRQN